MGEVEKVIPTRGQCEMKSGRGLESWPGRERERAPAACSPGPSAWNAPRHASRQRTWSFGLPHRAQVRTGVKSSADSSPLPWISILLAHERLVRRLGQRKERLTGGPTCTKTSQEGSPQHRDLIGLWVSNDLSSSYVGDELVHKIVLADTAVDLDEW